jgi:hypothetical protein
LILPSLIDFRSSHRPDTHPPNIFMAYMMMAMGWCAPWMAGSHEADEICDLLALCGVF